MNNFSQKIKTALESKTAFNIFLVLGILSVATIIFSVGVSVGMRKAELGHRFGDNYERNFGMIHRGPRGMMRMPFDKDFPNAHGAAGRILKVELPTIIVEEISGSEKVVRITDTTKIRTREGDAATEALKVDNGIVVIGQPNDQGQVEARFIRILPPPPTSVEINPVTK